MLALYLIWTTLVNDFKTLTWASIWYFPSMLLVQLVVRYLIIFILILATDKIPANIIQNSTNQSSLQNFGASIAGQVLPNMLVFIWAAIIAPLMENLFFIYVIQGIVLKKLIRSVKYGALIRIVIVAILFCLWHVQSVSDLNNPFFYQYLSLGWLAYIYEQTGNFVKTWIAHMGMNMIPMVAELLISGVIF
ncbi:hypothetical protein LOOC260_107490 [Paucilactobacillus hokkaidonensis JCM 18461]|uniref:CAAX prenyl protease 2/Lysostaphin resistance protein A-like domain-containing protein n=1 Tax=Paucilactobacillus hokkaidonensis JCM 18461 TaxID=1291742 RepID=A0A0A1GW73_9LACO|nr:hypothetical protein LOOC260_107490 [Paucilactobacillus hokkaidonensis JCM 18461]